MRWLRNSLLFFLILLLYGCASVPETIRDIQNLKQDHKAYIDNSAPDRALIAADEQTKRDTNYNSLYFSPWHRSKPQYQADIVERGFKKYGHNLGYGENGRKHGQSWMNSLTANAHLENYPNSSFTAITVDNADLRMLPTHKPRFHDASYSHRGYPFDSLQESFVAANTPVYISHMTKDRDWFLVETPYAVGWMSVRSIASVDGNFVKMWKRGRYAVIIKDKVPLYDEDGRFLFKAPLGSMFPKIGEDAKGVTILVAVADKNGHAFIKNAIVSHEAATSKPLRLTASNIANLANELLNEPYGWGGMYQNRDCSAMIKDLFAPFGIWLPRHSADQAKEGGTFVDLQKLSPEEKEMMIMKSGIPYLTLIWRQGHIMLYMGNYQSKALIFHNLWGIRTQDFLGRESRKVVGHAAITTLNPGIELQHDDASENNYLKGILGMTLLVTHRKEQELKQ